MNIAGELGGTRLHVHGIEGHEHLNASDPKRPAASAAVVRQERHGHRNVLGVGRARLEVRVYGARPSDPTEQAVEAAWLPAAERDEHNHG